MKGHAHNVWSSSLTAAVIFLSALCAFPLSVNAGFPPYTCVQNENYVDAYAVGNTAQSSIIQPFQVEADCQATVINLDVYVASGTPEYIPLVTIRDETNDVQLGCWYRDLVDYPLTVNEYIAYDIITNTDCAEDTSDGITLLQGIEYSIKFEAAIPDDTNYFGWARDDGSFTWGNAESLGAAMIFAIYGTEITEPEYVPAYSTSTDVILTYESFTWHSILIFFAGIIMTVWTFKLLM